jgi:hypothetical protein
MLALEMVICSARTLRLRRLVKVQQLPDYGIDGPFRCIRLCWFDTGSLENKSVLLVEAFSTNPRAGRQAVAILKKNRL